MSTVVAIQGPRFAVIASDTRITTDDQQLHPPAAAAKLKQVGEYLIGYAGDHQVGQVTHYVFQPPSVEHIHSQSELDWFISNNFIPDLKETWDNSNCTISSDTVDLLVVVKGIVYWIGSDFSWIRDTSGRYAIGSGGKYALGHISSLPLPTTPAKATALVSKSITTAHYLDVNTGGECVSYSMTIPKGWQ